VEAAHSPQKWCLRNRMLRQINLQIRAQCVPQTFSTHEAYGWLGRAIGQGRRGSYPQISTEPSLKVRLTRNEIKHRRNIYYK